MPIEKIILFVLIGSLAVGFAFVWFINLRRQAWPRPTGYQIFVGFITNFFDTLGIGSFATTTALFRLRRAIDDKDLPGTLNVGHSIPTIVQAYIFIKIIEVEMRTLAVMIAAALLGAWFGAGIVVRLPRRKVQIGMGAALLIAAVLLLAKLNDYIPHGGTTLGLEGTLLTVAGIGCFVFGALMTIGVGAYAPIMIMVNLLGMKQKTAFPIMMGACAFLMPSASVRFIRNSAYDPGAALGLTIGGIPAVILAATLVQELSPGLVHWLVVCVVIYSAISLLRAARV